MKIKEEIKPTAGMAVQTRLRAGADCFIKGNKDKINKCTTDYGQRMDTLSESANFKELLECMNSC